MDRKAVLIYVTICFMAMVTGMLLRLHLHLLSREHLQKHDFDDCSICRQLLISPNKFAVEPITYLPDKEILEQSSESLPDFHLTAFHYKPFDARPPQSCL